MNPNPRIAVSPDGRMMHVTESAYLNPEVTRKESIRVRAFKIAIEIKSIDERLRGLQMTPKKLRQAKFDQLCATRAERVKAYKELKRQFQDIPSVPPK